MKKDVFLLCDNAATYNKPKSQVHSDSIRYRKLMDNYEEPTQSVDTSTNSTPARSSTRGSKSGPAAQQQAMLKIIDGMLSLEHESGGLISQAFKNLPSRKFWADYYHTIERPISLNQIRTRILNSGYENWAAFEEDVLLIRKNAEAYNAEGSDIVEDARTLEKFFLSRLHDEKSKIGDPAPSGIKLRLNVPSASAETPITPAPKIKLNIKSSSLKPPPSTNGKPSRSAKITPPAPTPAPEPVTTRTTRQRVVTPTPSATTSVPTRATRLDSIRSNGNPTPPPNNYAEPRRSETPQQPQIPRMSQPPRNASFSPMPNQLPPTSVSNQQQMGYGQQPAYASHQEPVLRGEGKDSSHALISSLTLTSSSIMSPSKVSQILLPSETKVTSQYYVHLPSEFDTLTLTPTLSQALIAKDMYIVRVVHWSTHPGNPGNPGISKMIPPSGQKGRNEPVYNVRLHLGVVNTVEVTAVTQAAPGQGRNNGGPNGVERWEMERFRVFISSLQQ
ncbi:hypothetical protein FPQ18DRAFT_253151 [Pyronema domesticum]|nr:hypothetical protein FPQ18DRAFT_253151 [Pyronema domesticum]